MDAAYCAVTEDQGTAYGCVQEMSIDGDHMRVVLSSEALDELSLDQGVIQVQLAVPPESVEVLRDYLSRILTYGRPDARPTVLQL